LTAAHRKPDQFCMTTSVDVLIIGADASGAAPCAALL
jgi:hypothetical protein